MDPLRVNSAGMIPLIFAISVLTFPQFLAQLLTLISPQWGTHVMTWTTNFLNNPWAHNSLYFVLVFAILFGLSMDYELDVAAILRRGEQLFGHKKIASRLPDKTWHTYTYADFARRSKQLALALRNELCLADGDRVATFAWNHHEHLEAYIAAPVGGFVTHTLNLRLHPDDLTYIASRAGWLWAVSRNPPGK